MGKDIATTKETQEASKIDPQPLNSLELETKLEELKNNIPNEPSLSTAEVETSPTHHTNEGDHQEQDRAPENYKEWIDPKRSEFSEYIATAEEIIKKWGHERMPFEEFIKLKLPSGEQSELLDFISDQKKVEIAIESQDYLRSNEELLEKVESNSGDQPIVIKVIERIIHMRDLGDLVGADGLEKKLKETSKACGIKEKSLKQLFKNEVIKPIVSELNKTHAIMHIDKYSVLTEKKDLIFGGIEFSLESKQSFCDMYENQLVYLGFDKYSNKARVWLSSKNRRTYKGIDFCSDFNKENPNYYNLWKGFAITPKKGDCSRFRDLMFDVICNGNQEYYNWLWQWCARLIQKPDLIGEKVPVLVGDHGVGKNTFVDTLGKLLGRHYAPLNNIEQLLGRFNFHIKDKVLIYANEALWGGHQKSIGKLKSLVTDPYKIIEGKGKDIITVKNNTHLILASNNDWPVHLEPDERRFFVLKVSSKHKNDYPYFEELHKQLDSGGREALLHELLNKNISDFNPYSMPSNSEAFDGKLRTSDSCHRYIYEALKAGCFDIGKTHPNGMWPEKILTNSVFSDYIAWCVQEGIKNQDSRVFGKSISKLIPSINKVRPEDEKKRVHKYELPSLSKARSEFQTKYDTPDPSIWD